MTKKFFQTMSDPDEIDKPATLPILLLFWVFVISLALTILTTISLVI